ncbi:MAG: aminotransferase class V-fold PLP-dependent enzyme, partial [Acidobacteriota bacterium]|nr:aminotransferase class V-fold PLP-dependent enzyme [Acidobacteriota bacterium]
MSNLNHLDIEFVRSNFPGLDNGWAYFDNAGGSQILKGVVGKLNDFLINRNVQTGGTYETSLKTSAALLAGREAMARFINARRPEEIVFAPSTTVALNNLSQALRPQLQPGDEIIVTNSDHESNIGPWLRLAKDGVVIKTWELNKDSFELDLSDLEELMTDRTKLVAVTHVSNIIGTINPIAEYARFIHERGARICVDSVAFAPHRLIDVLELDVDFLVFSTYKTYGPHFAVMYGQYEQLLELDNLYHYFHGKKDVPRKLEPGNPSYELAFSLTGITDYFAALGNGATGNDRESFAAAFEKVSIHET